MGVLDDIKDVSGFDGVQELVQRALGDLSAPWGVFGATPGMTLEAIREHLGTPTFEQSGPDQRDLVYHVPLNHPEHGPRDHHVAKVVATSYRGEVVGSLILSVDYFGFGDLAPPWVELTGKLEAHLNGALGKPAKRTKTKVKTELTWTRDPQRLWCLIKLGSIQIDVAG